LLHGVVHGSVVAGGTRRRGEKEKRDAQDESRSRRTSALGHANKVPDFVGICVQIIAARALRLR
jgi:hypothetical protein